MGKLLNVLLMVNREMIIIFRKQNMKKKRIKLKSKVSLNETEKFFYFVFVHVLLTLILLSTDGPLMCVCAKTNCVDMFLFALA